MSSRRVCLILGVGSFLLFLCVIPWIEAPPTTLAVYAQTPQGEAPAVPAAVLPSKSFEFEPVVEGTKIIHDFVIQNKGQAPLFIHKVKTG